MTTFTIYCALFATTTLYAVLLAWLRHIWEPDLTWLEVVIGVTFCLLAPYADQRLNGPLTSELYEGRVWLAFIVGGFPIVTWQIGQSVSARLQAEQRIRGDGGSTAESTAALADERRTKQDAGD